MTDETAYVLVLLAPGKGQELDAIDEMVRLSVEAKKARNGYTFSVSEVELVASEITRLRSALTARDEALKETVRSLENCLMLARREKNRKDTNSRTLAAWTHVIRFCDEAGVEGGGILRDENDALSALAAAKETNA